MGISRLWGALRPAAVVNQTLPEFALSEGYMKQPTLGGLNVGIDVSIWIEQFSRSNWNHRARYSAAPELYSSFKRFCGLLSTCVHPVFVFDGPQRPLMKRGRAVILNDDWMVDDLKRMIAAFGFRSHMAPGEAEAELALMNKLGIIDAVVTDDSDIFIFGARTVIRNLMYQDNTSTLSIYHAELIESEDVLGLDRGGLVLVALLCGGDYHRTGLRGCGAATATGVARYGLGGELLWAAENLDHDGLQGFLVDWRIKLRHCFKKDPSGHIGRRHPAIARAITDSFPPLQALDYYVHPVVSDFPAFYQLPLPGPPDVRALARYCELENLFGGCKDILKKFKEVLWPGLVLRELLARAFAHANNRPLLPQSNLFHIEVMNATEDLTRLRVSNQALEQIVLHALYGLRDLDLAKYLLSSDSEILTDGFRYVRVPTVVLHDANAGCAVKKGERRRRGSISSSNLDSNVDSAGGSSSEEFLVGSSRDVLDLTLHV